MKRCTMLLPLLLLLMHSALAQDNFCNPDEPAIRFEGKAPAPWAIDGSVADWQTILGAYTGNPLIPYSPIDAGNNWSLDGFIPNRSEDLDSPSVREDLRFLAHTSDAYNVYLYARLQANTPGEHTLFYFFDINVDGYLSNGEPVLKVQYNAKKVTQLTLGEYMVNPDQDLGPTGGNYMTSPGPAHQGYVDGYTIVGKMTDLFSATRVPGDATLQHGEVFAAAVTEDGYGLEVSIPWRYLRNWVDNSNILEANDLFAYHAALEIGGGPYMPQRVVDNAGGCCGGLGIAGNADVVVGDLQASTIQPGTAYQFRFSFTNNTNVEELVGMKRIILDNFTLAEGATPDYTAFRITAYRDDECSGKPAGKQVTFEYTNEPSEGVVLYSSLTSIATSLKPGETLCFVVDLELPPNQFKAFSIYFNPDVSLTAPTVGCFSPSLIDGGKPINPAAFYIDEGVFTTRKSNKASAGEQSKAQAEKGIRVFPNPSRGTVNLLLPEGSPRNINLLDNTGRLVKQWRDVQPGVLTIPNLAKGVYFLRLADDTNRGVITRKFLVN